MEKIEAKGDPFKNFLWPFPKPGSWVRPCLWSATLVQWTHIVVITPRGFTRLAVQSPVVLAEVLLSETVLLKRTTQSATEGTSSTAKRGAARRRIIGTLTERRREQVSYLCLVFSTSERSILRNYISTVLDARLSMAD